jgi:hypothetical protein
MSQDNIFREVDEELRHERVRKLWRRFAPYVMAAAIGVVLIVAVNEGWSWYQNSNSARASDQYFSALELLDKGDVAGGQAALDAIATGANGGYAMLARFKEAALLAKDGKAAEAVAAYDALSTSEPNARLRELALVLAANILVDGGDLAAVEARVGGIAVDGNPMRNAAREAIGLAQYKAGDLKAARATFEAIAADPMVSQNISGRMQLYLAQLTAEGAVAPEAPAATPAPSATAPAPGADAAPAMSANPPAAEPATAPAQPSAMTAEPIAPAVSDAPATSEPSAPAPVQGQTTGN